MVSTIASTSLQSNYHNCPPILYDRGGGDLERYVVVASTNSTGAPAVFREETYESGFSELDSANRPTRAGGAAMVSIAVSVLGDIIYIATQYGTANNCAIEYHRFNMSSNTWTETNTSVFSGDSNITDATSVGIIVISSSNIIIVGQGTTRNFMGTRYDSVSYWQYTTSWGSEVEFDDAADGVHYRYPVIDYDGSAKAHLAYFDSTNVQHKSLTISGLSLSSAETVNDTAVATTPYPFITHYTASSTSRAVIGWIKSSNSHAYVSFVDTDGTPGAEQDATDVGVNNGTGIYGFKIAVDDSNDEIHIPYGDSSSSDLQKALYDGSWGTDSELVDAITVNHVGGASVVDDGGLTLCVLYRNGTTVTYFEESLGGGTTLTPSAAVLSLTAINPSLATSLGGVTASLGLEATNPSLSISTTPDPATLTLSASVGNVSQGVNVSPSAAILNLAAINPTLAITITANAILNLQAINPTLALGAYTPSPAILNLQAIAPTLSAILAGDTATLTLSASVGAVRQGVNVSPTAAILNLQAVAASLANVIIPSAAILSLAAINPSLATTISSIVAILNLQAQNPTLTNNLVGDSAILNLSALVGSVSVGGDVTLSPNPAILNLNAQAPSLATTLAGDSAILNLQAISPSLASTIVPGTAVLNLQAAFGALSGAVLPSAAILSLVAINPTVATIITPSGAILNLSANGSINLARTPDVATLNLQAQNPSLNLGISPAVAQLALIAARTSNANVIIPSAAILNLSASVGAVVIASALTNYATYVTEGIISDLVSIGIIDTLLVQGFIGDLDAQGIIEDDIQVGIIDDSVAESVIG